MAARNKEDAAGCIHAHRALLGIWSLRRSYCFSAHLSTRPIACSAASISTSGVQCTGVLVASAELPEGPQLEER